MNTMKGASSYKSKFQNGIYLKLLFVVLAFFLMVASSCLYVSNMLDDHFNNEAMSMLTYTKIKIETDVIMAETVLENLSDNVSGIIERGGGEADVSAYIREYVEYMRSNAGMSSLQYHNVFGYFNAFGDGRGVYISGEPKNLPADYDATKRPWYESAMAANGAISIEPVYKMVDPDMYVMSYSRSVSDSQGNVVFVIGLNLTLESIGEHIVEMHPTENSYGFLASGDNDIIAHTDNGQIGKNISDVSEELSQFIKELRMKDGVNEYKSTIRQQQKEVVFATLLDNGWIVSIVIPEGEYYGELYQMIVIISALGIVLALVLIIIFVRIDKAKKRTSKILKQQNALLEFELKNREIEEQTHIMLDSTPMCCKLWNRNMEVFACNEEAVRLFGLSSKQEFCEKFFELCPEFQPCGRPTADMAKEYLQKAFEDGYQRFEWLHKRLDGELLPAEVTLVRVKYKGDFVVAGYIRDLTEQKQMMEEIKTTNELNEIQIVELFKLKQELEDESYTLQTMFDSIPDLIYCKDLDFNYSRCNRSLLEYYAINENDLIGKDDVSGLKLSESKAKECRERSQLIVKDKTVITYEESLDNLNGETRIFETKNVPIVHNGVVTEIMGISRDITERKEMEETVQSANRAKSEFLANMSHEMRTPLNVVVGLTDLHLEEELPDAIRSDMRKINNAGNILLSIVNDVLDISKIEAGKLELVPVHYDTASLLNDIITLNMIRIESKPIDFKLDIDADMPACICGDELRLKQIFNNLLSNAFKYTHEGSVTLSVRCEMGGSTEDGLWMLISVSDTGIGIRQEDIKKLFSDYNQVDTRANRKIEGTGLGLAITKKLTEMMGGEITVDSEYGKGTTFRIRVKQAYVDCAPIGAGTVENLRSFQYMCNKQQVSAKLVRVDMSYVRVLVVDDMPTNLDVATGLMGKYKMKVDCVGSGQEAIDRIKRGKPVYNAVFMDHMMPNMDGIEATKKIRGLDSQYAKTVPIISLTANATVGNEQMFLDNGFQDFLSKPIDILALDAVLRKWVRDKSKETAAPRSQVPAPESESGKTIIQIPGVNEKKGLSIYGGDADIYISVLRSFATHTPTVIESLRDVTEEGLKVYAINVHGLKGSSSNIGAQELSKKAERMEMAAKAGDFEEVQANNDGVINEAQKLVADVIAWLDKQDTGIDKPRMREPDPELLESLRQYCEQYNMNGVDTVMEQLESSCYDIDGDLIIWMREMADISNLQAIAERITTQLATLGHSAVSVSK
ncbi:MAG: ATP-binding protein [Oscillospiraceae bacterium]|nr:ATP-binding protein [Oscillospiraceae bacterium]